MACLKFWGFWNLSFLKDSMFFSFNLKTRVRDLFVPPIHIAVACSVDCCCVFNFSIKPAERQCGQLSCI